MSRKFEQTFTEHLFLSNGQLFVQLKNGEKHRINGVTLSLEGGAEAIVFAPMLPLPPLLELAEIVVDKTLTTLGLESGASVATDLLVSIVQREDVCLPGNPPVCTPPPGTAAFLDSSSHELALLFGKSS